MNSSCLVLFEFVVLSSSYDYLVIPYYAVLKNIHQREVKLQQDIARYDEGITAMQKNLKEVKRSRKNVIASIKKAEKRIANTSNDNADTKEKLEEEKQKSKAFDAFIIKKNKGFEVRNRRHNILLPPKMRSN